MRKSRRQPVDPWPEGIFWSEHKTDSFFTCGKPWPWRISGDLPKKQKGSCAFFLAHRDFRKRIASVWPVQSTENRAELDTFGKSSCGRVRTKWYPFAHGAAGWLSGEWAEAQELGTKKAVFWLDEGKTPPFIAGLSYWVPLKGWQVFLPGTKTILKFLKECLFAKNMTGLS